MFRNRILFVIFFTLVITYTSNSQTYVFAELNGSPNLNTNGWNLNGNAFVGDTPGDTDNFLDELILTNAWNTQSGGVFYSTPIDPSICSNWTVEFEYRIWGGSAADGIAFSFLDVPPTGFVSGGGCGIPGSANGLKVVLDAVPTHIRTRLEVINNSLVIIFGIAMLVNGSRLALFTVEHIMPALNISRSFAYWPFVAAGLFISIFALERLILAITSENSINPPKNTEAVKR